MAWWESWFGEEYLDLYSHRDLDAAQREALFALEHLPGAHRAPLLDLCCGSGLHAPHFAAAGVASVGLDYSAPQLAVARGRDACLRLVRGDMRRLPFADASFAAVVNFFTSFGYFRDETEDRVSVGEIARVLRAGGSFLCDTFGVEHVLARLVPEETREANERRYRIRRRWNPSTRRIEKEIEVRRDGDIERFRESVRAYTREELTGLLEGAGLGVEAVWGDFDGCQAGGDSPRLIALARKA
jgi:SAM-dependent methyltransferase